MTFADGLWLALLRAVVVAVITVAAAGVITCWLRETSRRARRAVAAFLIAIVFTPMLVLGYVYSSGDLTLVRYPRLNDLLYGLLLGAKYLPIAVGVLYFGPPPAVSDAAKFCAALVPRDSAMAQRRWRTRWALAMQANGRALLLAGIAVFLLSFQEFELASLLNGSSGRQASAYSWTIALHEARELQVPLTTIGSRALLPIAIQLAALLVGMVVLMRSGRVAAESSTPAPCRNATRIAAMIITAAAWLLVCALPWFIVIRTGVGGLGTLFSTFEFGDELQHSVLFAGAATVFVFILLDVLRHPRMPRVVMIACCVPGLMGGLLLALSLIAIAQPLGPLLATLNLEHSPIPLLVGLVAWLLPIALLLHWLFSVTRPRSALHTAKLSKACATDGTHRLRVRQLIWRLGYRGWYWLAMLIFSLAYFELILSVLLAPTSMTSAMALLYNLFHYGQNAVRSAMILVLVAVPVVLLLLSLLVSPAFALLVRTRSSHHRN